MVDDIGWNFDNTYSKLPKLLMSSVLPSRVKMPGLVVVNSRLAKNLDLNFSHIEQNDLAAIFSGNKLPVGSKTIAQAYAGHQFGFFTMLGDGRAVLLGEHLNKKKIRFDVQLKGCGKTPYSRHGDGKAALGPVLREYIISEAMESLGIPTTRSLAVVTTGEGVVREKILPGAILVRVASSHLRVGTFQYLSSKKDIAALEALVNYTIERHYPKVSESKNPPLGLLVEVIDKQIDLIVQWMRVGFVHGVMNTDNMAVSGETIDYGPCAFMNNYNPKTVFSSIDYQGRYSYENQPAIAHWNLLRFAETLLPLINKNEGLAISAVKSVFANFTKNFKSKWLAMMKKKFGLLGENDEDEGLVQDFLKIIEKNNTDFTNAFLYLSNDIKTETSPFKNEDFISWNNRWKNRLKKNEGDFLSVMKKNNPLVIPRNHNVEYVLKEAETKNLGPFNMFMNFLRDPYISKKEISKYQEPPKDGGVNYKTFCGT